MRSLISSAIRVAGLALVGVMGGLIGARALTAFMSQYVFKAKGYWDEGFVGGATIAVIVTLVVARAVARATKGALSGSAHRVETSWKPRSPGDQDRNEDEQ